MHGLSNTALIDLGDSGRSGSPVERGLLLLAAALPGEDAADLAALSIPRRDAALLAWRHQAFGPALPGVADCPACGVALEFDFDGRDLLAAAAASPEPDCVHIGGQRFRLPNSRDLLAVAAVADPGQATRRLLAAWRLDAGPAESRSDAWLADAEAALAAHAGASDTRFELGCESCGHAWEAPFDICSYFWEEIERRAQALLDDVHRLALAYGWSESAILALSDARRAAYVTRCET